MYKLEHLLPRTDYLPLYPVRLTPADAPYLHYTAEHLTKWSETHKEFIHQSGYNLYFKSERAAILFMLGHNHA